MPTIADTVARCAAANLPVLFLDTCSILDVIRAPHPKRPQLRGCAQGATQVLEGATGPPPRWSVVVSSLVRREWSENRERVAAESDNHLKRMTEDAALFHSLCAHLSVSVPFAQPDYARSALGRQLQGLSEQLLNAALHLDTDPDAVSRAAQRVYDKRAPSLNGGEFKDCVIFEECLEVARRLRATAFARGLIFCTSNTSDYGEPNTDIKEDCDALGVTFVTNLPWAVKQLKS